MDVRMDYTFRTGNDRPLVEYPFLLLMDDLGDIDIIGCTRMRTVFTYLRAVKGIVILTR